MSELILPFVIDFAKSLVQEFLVEKLQEIFSDSRQEETITQEEPIFKLEIRDAKIIEEIGKILEKRNDRIINELKNNNEMMENFTQQVLSEFKTLSKQISEQNPELEFEDDEIIFLPPQHEEDEKIDKNELMGRLKRIEKSLDEIVAQKRAEIETKSQPKKKEPPISPVGRENTDVQPPESPENSESQKILEKLHQYKEYGDSFLQKLKLFDNLKQFSQNQSQKNEILDNSQLQDFLKKLKETANKTVELASSQVKIAVMGEYSSGKTRLIESLIGYGGILPASEIPSTGNVTAVYLTQENDFKTTEFGKFNVEYLHEKEVRECLNFMRKEAEKRGKEAGLELPALPEENLETLNEYTLKPYESWCEEVWNKTQNLELRYLLRELVIFIRTCISYGAFLYGENFDIDRTTADKGLKLADRIPPPNQELKFEDIPSVNMIPVDDKQFLPEVLENSFSLIRRVNINVKVSKEIWDLGTTQDTAKFILLDFPGLGSANSGVRDTFVSLRELESVQTILILLNAKTPGNDRANKIVTMLGQKKTVQNLKDQILVGVSRFNQLLEAGEAETKLDRLININAPLTEEIVLQELDVLRSIDRDAKGFTSQADNIVFLDQLMCLRELGEKNSNGVRVGTTEFLDMLGNRMTLKSSREISQKWKSLSKRLLETDPDNSLGKKLDYFAFDGGITELRRLLLEHLADRSLKQLYEDTHKAVNTLQQQQLQFKDILLKLGILNQESEDLKELRLHLRQMYSVYKKFADDLGKEPLKDFQEVAVSDLVKDEITYQILNWKQWNLLFARAQNGRIVVSSKRGNEGKFLRRRNSADNIPTKSDDFYEGFEKTLEELQQSANTKIEQAIENLLNNLSNKLVEDINYLEGILDQEKVTDIEKKVDEKAADIFYALCQGYAPKKWLKPIMDAAKEEQKSIEIETAFPLARKDQKHNHGQIFDWATEYSQINSSRSSSNQLLLVQRLRDEIITSISLHLTEYISQINEKVNQVILEDILNDLNPQLLECLKQDRLLRYILGEKQELNEENSNINDTLSEIAFLYRPEALP